MKFYTMISRLTRERGASGHPKTKIALTREAVFMEECLGAFLSYRTAGLSWD